MRQLSHLSDLELVECEAATMLEIELMKRFISLNMSIKKVKDDYAVQMDIRKDILNMEKNMHNLNGISIKRKLKALGEMK